MKRLIIFLVIILGLFIFSVLIDLRSIAVLAVMMLVLIALAIYDFMQTKHSVMRNFPVIGRLRFLMELIRPEIRQYFIASNQEERPFNRETRSVIYQRAKKVLDTQAFGTQHDMNRPGYLYAKHSLSPTKLPQEELRVWVGGPQCAKPYHASRLNISALSYGALSKNAILALNRGAKTGHFAHNTGEGGVSPYHLEPGGDLVWQLGTAMFGCRTHEGRFNPELFVQTASLDAIKMIEIKLSQGAKPSHGGILPGRKITPEISAIRGVPMGQDCISPPTNPEFDTPAGLLEFVARLRELSGGKPVGFKLAIGVRSEFLSICKAMLSTGILPDFICVDSGEGGTGAAPLEFSDYLGEPFPDALIFVHNALVGVGLRDAIRVIASGKVATGFDLITHFATGADMCNSGRGMMFALGCIQSLQCNKNTCPTGVTTSNARLMRGLVPEEKYQRVASFHDATLASFVELASAMGIKAIRELSPWHIFKRDDDGRGHTFAEMYTFLESGAFLTNNIHPAYARDWQLASATQF